MRLWESPHFEIIPTHGDLARFDSVNEFLRDMKLHGYYGGLRLIKAAIKRFHDYCRQKRHRACTTATSPSASTPTSRAWSACPGSSAIITATMRALMEFYEVDIPRHLLPTLVLSVEKDELGISAGLQDRVIQTYEGDRLHGLRPQAASRRAATAIYERAQPAEAAAAVRRVRPGAGGGQRRARTATCASCSTAATRPSSRRCRSIAT